MNLQKELDALLPKISGKHLLLHSCCAPCSSSVLEYLSQHLKITLLFYNPNILPESEYHRRLEEQERLLKELHGRYPVTLIKGTYDAKDFLSAIHGLEDEPEGGNRCTVCYRLRLEKGAETAASLQADYFTTTLSVSPHKDALRLHHIGKELEQIYGVPHLPSDFKKKGGYQRSIQLSKEHSLYRQDWCGCPFSKREHDKAEGNTPRLSQTIP